VKNDYGTKKETKALKGVEEPLKKKLDGGDWLAALPDRFNPTKDLPLSTGVGSG
jgi:hypothetical protein